MPIKFTHIILIALACGLTVASGQLVRSRSTDGEAERAAREEAVARLAGLPEEFGGWKREESLPLEESALRMLLCEAQARYRYVNAARGMQVELAILFGPPGSLGAHSPEVCYAGLNYTVIGTPQLHVARQTSTRTDMFWCAGLVSPNAAQQALRVYYAWSDGGAWQAPQHPRLTLSTTPRVYKLLLSTRAPDGQKIEDAGASFLRDFLAVWNKNPAATVNP